MKQILLGTLLFILSVNAKGQNITKFEYFIDADPGFGLATAASPTASPTITDFSIPISVTALSNGFHTLYIRGQNTAGTWTPTHFRTFYIVTPLAPPPTTITQVEYFVDTDPGIGAAIPVTGITPAATISNLAIDLTTAAFTPGFHTLYVRAKTAAGDWTQTHFRTFYIVAPLAPPATTITQVEYFVDTDPGVGAAIPVPGITPASTISNLPVDIEASSYTAGFHTLYVRAKTAAGQWTQTHFRNFYITPSLPPVNNLVKFEYFFDTDPGFDNGTPAPITSPAPSVTNQDIFAVPSSLSIGTHTIYVRAKDSSGDWTQVSTGTFSVTAPALPTIAGFTPASGPAGTSVTITGTNFTGTTSVTFGGTAATSFTLVSPTTITAVVDTGTSGVISVTNGVGTATSGTMFTVTLPTTLAISPQPISSSVCDGDVASFTTSASGTTNITYQWQFSIDGIVPFADIANDTNYSNTTTSTLSVSTIGSFGAGRYRCRIDGDLATTTFTNDAGLFVNALPSAPTASSVGNCGPGTVTLNASGGTNGNYIWYDQTNTVITGQVNSTYATPSLSATTNFSVAITNGTCTSTATLVTVTINAVPAAPASADVTICGPGSVMLSSSGGTNGNYIWYDPSNAVIAGQSNSTYTTPVIAATTAYSVAITNGTCISTQATLTATINSVPAAPSTQDETQCTGSTFALTASGGTNGQYIWYTTPSGGSAIAGQVNSTFVTPALTSNTTYYVSIDDGACESSRAPVTATVNTSGCSIPAITPASIATQVGGTVSLNLVPLITTVNNNLNLSSIVVTQQPGSGATASVSNGVLTVDYNGITFSGTEQITIQACDTDGNCTTQIFAITVAGDIVIYNGISPNGKNPAFIIDFIDLLPETKLNSVNIFDRWENLVWHGTNYDNSSVVFTGSSDGGNDLPSGVYYYKIVFSSGRKTETGFLSLHRQ